MAERNDDIKQLFSHLGLNPSDYQELRVPPRKIVPGAETSRRAGGAQAARGEVDAPRTYTRTPASIRPLPAMPPPAMPRVAPAAVERSPLLSFFEAVKEPISSPPVPVATPAVDPQTEANRAVTDRMIQDIKDISRRISRDIAPPPKSRWADIPEISKPLDKQPPRGPLIVGPTSPPVAVRGPIAASVPAAEAGKLKLRFGAPPRTAGNVGGESLQDVFERLAHADPKKS